MQPMSSPLFHAAVSCGAPARVPSVDMFTTQRALSCNGFSGTAPDNGTSAALGNDSEAKGLRARTRAAGNGSPHRSLLRARGVPAPCSGRPVIAQRCEWSTGISLSFRTVDPAQQHDGEETGYPQGVRGG